MPTHFPRLRVGLVSGSFGGTPTALRGRDRGNYFRALVECGNVALVLGWTLDHFAATGERQRLESELASSRDRERLAILDKEVKERSLDGAIPDRFSHHGWHEIHG